MPWLSRLPFKLGSILGRTSTQGLKIIEEKMSHLYYTKEYFTVHYYTVISVRWAQCKFLILLNNHSVDQSLSKGRWL